MNQEQVRIFIDLTDFEHLTQARTAINWSTADPAVLAILTWAPSCMLTPSLRFLDHVLVEGQSRVCLFPEHFRTGDLRPSSMSPEPPAFEYQRANEHLASYCQTDCQVPNLLPTAPRCSEVLPALPCFHSFTPVPATHSLRDCSQELRRLDEKWFVVRQADLHAVDVRGGEGPLLTCDSGRSTVDTRGMCPSELGQLPAHWPRTVKGRFEKAGSLCRQCCVV